MFYKHKNEIKIKQTPINQTLEEKGEIIAVDKSLLKCNMTFVSCEDELPHPLGVFNVACTVTSFVIMIVPIHFLHQSIKKNRSVYVLLSSSTTTTLRSSRLRSISPLSFLISVLKSVPMIEQIMYSISLSSLFFFNLYEHLTGYTGPPSIQTFGLVNNTMLAALLYRLWWNTTSHQKKTNLLHYRLVTLISFIVSMCLVAIGFVADPQWEQSFAQILSGPMGIYVIYTMGRLSWMRERDQRKSGEQNSSESKRISGTSPTGSVRKLAHYVNLFQLWQLSCIFLILVVIGTEIESSLCNLEFLASENSDDQLPSFGQYLLSRFYHSIFLHIIIPALFYCVSECAFQLCDTEWAVIIENIHAKKEE